MSKHYSPSDSMSSLISENYSLIHIMTRFGIRIGFGDKTVEEVCSIYGVDTNTFLGVVNFFMEGFTHFDKAQPLSLPSLMQYLKQSHIYFLNYSLPSIRRKLLDGIRVKTNDVSFFILKFFDEYYDEVKTHMEYEEKTVFKYVEDILEGSLPEDFHISTYSDHHEQVSLRLGELKKILIRYCPEDADPNLINDVLFRIFQCEKELSNHCMVEDALLVPEIKRLEKRLTDNKDM